MRIQVYLNKQRPGKAAPAHSCTASLAALVAAAFPQTVTYDAAGKTLKLHTADSFPELRRRARGFRGRKCVAVIRDSGMPLMLSYPPNGQESDAKARQKALWKGATRF